MVARLKFAIVSILIFSTAVLSVPVNANIAELAARNYARSLGRDTKSPIPIDDGGDVIAFVFPLDGRGYIVTSTDTDIEPIIAYSLGGDFDFILSRENILLEMITLDMELRRDAIGLTSPEILRSNNEKWERLTDGDGAYLRALESSEIYGPHLITRWHQSMPFNAYCPIDPSTGSRTITGCTATSLAQIVNYWRYPAFVKFTEADNYRSGYEPPTFI